MIFIHRPDVCPTSHPYSVRLIHLYGHLVDCVRGLIDHFEDAGSTQGLSVDGSGELKTHTAQRVTDLLGSTLSGTGKECNKYTDNVITACVYTPTSSLSKNSRTSGSCNNDGWDTILWRYLHRYKRDEAQKRQSATMKTSALASPVQLFSSPQTPPTRGRPSPPSLWSFLLIKPRVKKTNSKIRKTCRSKGGTHLQRFSQVVKG